MRTNEGTHQRTNQSTNQQTRLVAIPPGADNYANSSGRVVRCRIDHVHITVKCLTVNYQKMMFHLHLTSFLAEYRGFQWYRTWLIGLYYVFRKRTPVSAYSSNSSGSSTSNWTKGAITSKLDGTPSLAASWNKMLMRAETVVQVLQDLFYVLLHVLFYLWSLLNSIKAVTLSSLSAAVVSGSVRRQFWGDCEQREAWDGTDDQVTDGESGSTHVGIRYVMTPTDSKPRDKLALGFDNDGHKQWPWRPQTCILKDGVTVNSPWIWRFLKSRHTLVFHFFLAVMGLGLVGIFSTNFCRRRDKL